ncbi:hypothetical protein BGZ98_004122 [Dissophora globulifera]|nr:hypothetical protein BGZ98_004122 [Dissophora globulifera]
MIFKTTLLLVAALAAPALVLAEEPATCNIPAVRYNITGIVDEKNFCTMIPAMGVQDVAPYEACALSHCVGTVPGVAANTPTMPSGFIKSAHFVNNATNGFIQITGCIDSTVLALNVTDEGGQMDSHGWQYKCAGYSKFVSLIEPATNTYCIRCCNTDVDVNCDTAHSTHGCWNLIPGQYTLDDGVTSCPAPAGAPVVVATTTAGAPVSSPTSGSSAPGAPTGGAGAGAGTGGSSGSGAGAGVTVSKPSAGSRSAIFSVEMVGMVAAAALGVAAAL